MLKKLKEIHRLYQTRFSFGMTSAIITNLSLITGLDTLKNARLGIVGGILAIAIADNIADSLGIHIYQDSECVGEMDAWITTLTNFLTRLAVSLTFIIPVLILPIEPAVIFSIIWGLTLLAFLSYSIAKKRDVNPYRAMAEHLAIAAAVIVASNYVGKFLIMRFR